MRVVTESSREKHTKTGHSNPEIGQKRGKKPENEPGESITSSRRRKPDDQETRCIHRRADNRLSHRPGLTKRRTSNPGFLS